MYKSDFLEFEKYILVYQGIYFKNKHKNRVDFQEIEIKVSPKI